MFTVYGHFDLQLIFGISGYLLSLQIFINREGGNKSFASVLAPGQHEGLVG